MSYVVCRDEGIQMDLMVKKKYWPKLIGHIQRSECTYKEEKEIEISGESWIRVVDIQAKYGYELGGLLGLFYGMEWDSLKQEDETKFYILLGNKKEAGRNARKTRKKAHAGRKGGADGKPAGDIRPGKAAGPGGDGAGAGDPGADAVWGIEGLEIPDHGDDH